MEKILCAAIHYIGEELQMDLHPIHPVRNSAELPKGVTVCGWRHSNCISVMKSLSGINTRRQSSIQGFLTSTGRFVNRLEANTIAIAANQTEGNEEGDELISEDLY